MRKVRPAHSTHPFEAVSLGKSLPPLPSTSVASTVPPARADKLIPASSCPSPTMTAFGESPLTSTELSRGDVIVQRRQLEHLGGFLREAEDVFEDIPRSKDGASFTFVPFEVDCLRDQINRLVHRAARSQKQKNRYADILPYDDTRVKLSAPESNPSDDYINACYVVFPTVACQGKFICSQGPLPSTVVDMWYVICGMLHLQVRELR